MNDDAVLLRRYAEEKSEAAFAELVQRHVDLVYSSALRRLNGDAHAARDVAQQVFTALARDPQKLSRHTVLTAWLYTATRNAAIDLIRAEQRRHTREQEASTMHTLFATPPATDWEKLRPVLDAVMDELSDADRAAVLMRFFQQRAFADVGAAFHLGEDAARMRVDRALEKLRALLARRGITSTTAALATALANQAIVAAPAGLAASIAGTALSGAATGATAMATTGFFMSTTTAIISAVALAAIGSTAYEVSQAHQAELARAALDQERDGLRAQLSALQQRADRSEQDTAALQSEVEALRGKAVPSATTTMNRGEVSTEAAQKIYLNDVAKNVAERAAQEGAVKSLVRAQSLDNTYRPLYRQLNFSPAQAEQFKALLAEKSQRREDIAKEAHDQGVRPNDSSLQPILAQAGADFAAKLREAFGDAAGPALQHFNETLPSRELVNRIETNLFYADAPLTPPQAEQLVDIFAAAARNAGGYGAIGESKLNTTDILAQAQGVLSPPQLEILRQLADQFDAQRSGTVMFRQAGAK